MNNNIRSEVKAIITGVFVFLTLITLALLIVTVPAGSVKIVTRFGRVTGRVLHPGIHVKIPFVDGVMSYNTKKVIYETTSEKKQKTSEADYKDYPVDTNTADGQQVDVFYTVRFSIDPTRATLVAQKIGTEEALVEKIVKTESRIWTRNIPREFEAADLYTGSVVDVQNEIAEKLRPVFQENGLILDSVGIREIKFTGQYVQAIEEKQIEAVRVETAQNKAEQAKFEKEARIIKAQGQAEEQRLQRETLTTTLLQKLWIETWDGKLPTYTGGATPLIQLPQ